METLLLRLLLLLVKLFLHFFPSLKGFNGWTAFLLIDIQTEAAMRTYNVTLRNHLLHGKGNESAALRTRHARWPGLGASGHLIQVVHADLRNR